MSDTRTRLPGEIVFCCLMVMLSSFLLWTAIGISGFKSYTSAGSYPMAASTTMLVCSLVILFKTARAERAPAHEGEGVWAHFVRAIVPPVVLWVCLAIVGYMALLEVLGFIASSFAFLVISMRLLGGTRWGLNALVSALAVAAINVVFQTAFSVVLPEGTLWQGVMK